MLISPAMIAEQIFRYLMEHQDAVDAAEGIREYWLDSIRATTEEVQNSLDLLVQRGWVVVSESRLTPCLYRLNKARLKHSTS